MSAVEIPIDKAQYLVRQLEIPVEKIEALAYQLWVERGYPEGDPLQDYFNAKTRLQLEAIRGVLSGNGDDEAANPNEAKTSSRMSSVEGTQNAWEPASRLPRVFVASSSESLQIAQRLQVLLSEACEIKLWSQGVFGPGEIALDALLDESRRVDFAVIVLSPDDYTVSRDDGQWSPRDNVVFELALFLRELGRERTFVVHQNSAKLKLPTDLVGITTIRYHLSQSNDWNAALGPAASLIQLRIAEKGCRSSHAPSI